MAEARKFLLLIGQEQLGPADERVKAALEGIEDVGQLEELGRRVLHAGSWQELLPASKPPKGRRRKKTEP